MLALGPSLAGAEQEAPESPLGMLAPVLASMQLRAFCYSGTWCTADDALTFLPSGLKVRFFWQQWIMRSGCDRALAHQ